MTLPTPAAACTPKQSCSGLILLKFYIALIKNSVYNVLNIVCTLVNKTHKAHVNNQYIFYENNNSTGIRKRKRKGDQEGRLKPQSGT